MGTRRLGPAIAVAAVAIVAATLPAHGADTTPPNGLTQAPKDGCQRNAVGLLTFTSPEWVFIRGDQTTHFIEGKVLEDSSHPAPGGGDLPEGHEWYDFNGDIAPTDPALAYQAGLDNEHPGKLFDSIHTERESGQVPVAAWMTADDNAALWGSWIWDCGHWGPGLDFSKPDDEANRDYVMPGQGEDALPGDTGKEVGNGETAEFHPVKAFAITRTNPFFSPVEQTETDFYVSNYGTIAHAEEVCAANSTKVGPAMGPDYTECLQDPLNRHWAINDSDYTFFIPAPPKPPGVANPQLRVTVKDNDGNVGPQPTPILDVRADGVQVTVPYKGMADVPAVPQCPVTDIHPEHNILPPYDCPSQATSKAFFVGWEGGDQRIRAEAELTLKSVTVHKSLDVPEFTTSAQQPPGEYGINMDVNGLWAYINDYAPGLDHVYGDQDPGGEGQGGPMQILDKDGKPAAFRLRVKDGGRIRMFFPTRECDLPHMNPCFATDEAAEDNDGPGDAKVFYKSVDEAVGDHVIKGGGTANAPNWEISYSIKKISDARVAPAANAGSPGGPVTGPAATTYPNSGTPANGGGNEAGKPPEQQAVLGERAGCVDTYTPRSRFRGPSRRDSHRSPVRAGRRGLSLRGRAEDADCHGKPGKVKRVEIAIARLSGKRCHFLGANGRFGGARSCSAPSGFRKAKGTTAWRYGKRVRLARGRYVAYSRAIDPAGNTEYKAHTGNRARFTVR